MGSGGGGWVVSHVCPGGSGEKVGSGMVGSAVSCVMGGQVRRWEAAGVAGVGQGEEQHTG